MFDVTDGSSNHLPSFFFFTKLLLVSNGSHSCGEHGKKAAWSTWKSLLTETFNLINTFSKVPNHTVMMLGILQARTCHLSLPFLTGNIRYLGTDIFPRLPELFHLNYTPPALDEFTSLRHRMNCYCHCYPLKKNRVLKILLFACFTINNDNNTHL